MLKYIATAKHFIDNMTFEEFQEDEKTILAVTRAVEIVGEAAKNIPISIREQYPDIAWKEIVGMRDRLAHGYFSLNLEILWEAAHSELPMFQSTLNTMLERQNIKGQT